MVDDFDMPMPDLMILKAPVDWRPIVASDVQLLIEVAVSHPERDLDDQLPHYLRVGIPEIWIVNVPRREIEVFRPPSILPEAVFGVGRGTRISPPLPQVDITELFEGMPVTAAGK